MKPAVVTIFSVIFLFDYGSTGNKDNYSNNDLKIIGGKFAEKNAFPFTVALVSHTVCGGTLVKFNAIITAASCLYKEGKQVDASTVNVIAGALGLEDPKEPGYQESRLVSYKVHDKYTGKKESADDIALGTLAKTFDENRHVQIAQYAGRKTSNVKDALVKVIEADSTCIVLGWGSTDGAAGTNSKKLKMVEVRILPHAECHVSTDMETTQVCVLPRQASEKGMADGDEGTTFICQGKFFGVNRGPLKYTVDAKEYDGAVVTVIWPYIEYFGLELNVATPNQPGNTFKLVLFLIFIVSSSNLMM